MSARKMSKKFVGIVENLPQSAFWDMDLIHEIVQAAAYIGRCLESGAVPDEKVIFGGRIARYLEVNAA